MTERFAADVVVVGAGSAGAVLAGTLARDPACRVLLIEAGGRDWNPLLRVPLMTGVLLRGRHANWFYHSEPEPGLNNRRLFWPRGKVLGGSSAINGMVWTRGTPSDYDGWAQRGLPDWTWEKVLPAYRAIECYWRGDSPWHGGSGPQPVTRLERLHPLSQAFLEAGQAAGHPLAEDFNGPAPEGVGQYDFTISGGRRVSAANAYLAPLRGRANLQVLTGGHVLGLMLERGRAKGVEVALGGRRLQVHAAHEVVLSAGTVNTPQILMLSGIGPAEALRAHDIEVRTDLPGVGQNLQDHLLVRVEHDCTEPITLHALLRADRAALALGQALVSGTGPAARFPLEVGAFLRSDPSRSEPDLQAHFLPGLSTAAVRMPFSRGRPGAGHGFFANIYQLRPESRGEVALRSGDPLLAPLIRGNYLSAPVDIAMLRAGVRALRDIFAQAPFDRWRGAERAPGHARQSDADLDAWIRANADTVFHPVGTCRMGIDAMAVTDSRLRVHGVEGLRVADASVMPAMPGCNTHAPSMMIGARAAEFIATDLGLSRKEPELDHAS
ncbi:MAG: GMC family oxidoreductase N-terminal domain-containing protein [Rhodobacteraceae bacterium]|nr:GMC family oxidoreductase N-terminal domain-containing protein [Paracoccaceae bacterium]